MTARIGLTVVIGGFLSAILVGQSIAQVMPTDIRTGIVQETGDELVDMFIVPGDSIFVLTDLSWHPQSFWTMGMSWNADVSIFDNYDGVWRGAAFALRLDETFIMVDSHPFVEKAWTTGIVFHQNHTMSLGVAVASTITWIASWSGYLVPVETVRVGEAHSDDLGQELIVEPNPGAHRASLNFSLEKKSTVLLAIFDVQGRKIRTLYSGELSNGQHSIDWDGMDDRGLRVAQGVYFARLEYGDATQTSKLTRIR